jgi:hypothetical protein
VPEATEALVEFFLDTEAPEMDYEIARCRPRLTPEFFSYLDKQIGGCGAVRCGVVWLLGAGQWQAAIMPLPGVAGRLAARLSCLRLMPAHSLLPT